MTQIVRFCEIASLIRGVSFDKSDSKSAPADGLIPILRAGNIQERLETDRDLVWVPEGRVSGEQLLQPGDIAIAVSSGSTALVGKTAQLLTTWRGSVGAFCAVIRPKLEVNPAYLALWLRSPRFSAWRDSRVRGSNIQNLQLAELGDAAFTLPSMEEQAELVSAATAQLVAAADAESASTEQLRLGTALSNAILRAAFGADSPVVAGTTGSPGNGVWQPLRSLAKLESGHTPSRRHPEWWGGSVPWLALPDIRKLHGLLAYDTIEYTNDLGITNSSARLLPVGTVCLCRDASIGFVTMLGRPMATSQHFCNWICDPEKLDSEFLLYAFMASFDYLRDLGSGSVLKTIYMPTIESFHLRTPSLPEQRQIALRLRDQLAQARQLRNYLTERQSMIERLPKRILADAFVAAA